MDLASVRRKQEYVCACDFLGVILLQCFLFRVLFRARRLGLSHCGGVERGGRDSSFPLVATERPSGGFRGSQSLEVGWWGWWGASEHGGSVGW